MTDCTHETNEKHRPIPAAGLLGTLWRNFRRVFIFVVGMTVLAIGVVMIVAPGPSVLVIPAGLGILATEFLWARQMLRRMKLRMRQAVRVRQRKANAQAAKTASPTVAE